MGRGQRSDDGVPGHVDGNRPAMKPELAAGLRHLGAEASSLDVCGGRIIANSSGIGFEAEGDGHFLACRQGDLIEQGYHSCGGDTHGVAAGDFQCDRLRPFVRQADSALFSVGGRQLQGPHRDRNLITRRGVARNQGRAQRVDHRHPTCTHPRFRIRYAIAIGRAGRRVHERGLNF